MRKNLNSRSFLANMQKCFEEITKMLRRGFFLKSKMPATDTNHRTIQHIEPQEERQLQVRSVGRFTQDGKLLGMESVDDIAALDPLDVGARLDELSQLEDGWLDGEGKAPSPDGIQWLAESFDRYFPDELRLPYLCATEDGGICAEWPLNPFNLSLEINLENHSAYWHAMDFTNDTFTEKEDIDLNLPASWNWLCEQLKQNGGVS